MSNDREPRPSELEDPEYHIVRPEQDRSAYSDAYYRSAPREGGTSYGYNPARYYTGGEPCGPHRGQIGIRALLALCLAAVIGAGVLGIGGLYLLSRDRREARQEGQNAISDEIYAQVSQDQDPEGPLTASAPPADAAAIPAEDIYAAACGQVVGIRSTDGRVTETGSGFIVTDDGYILTNYHVIETGYARGLPITVVTQEGTEYPAQVTGTESDSDLAVLKIEAEGLHPAAFGDADATAVGERVYTVGDPLGDLPYTMTRGTLSARDRQITIASNATVNMFQFDAAVNRGSSGGPLYNAYGQVIGVVTAKYAAAGVEGLGFAIPSSEAVAIANELITKGYVSGKAYLGLVLDNTYTPSVAQYYRRDPGAYVASVQEGSAAQQAGLQAGDVITAVDGAAIYSADGLVAAVKGYSAGDTAELTVNRSGEVLSLAVTFGQAVPEDAAS